MKNRELPLILALVLLFVVAPATFGQDRPTTIDELTNRMKLALTSESPSDFLSLFWQDGMDDRVRDALNRAVSGHIGDEVVGVKIEPPGDCSWCTYERKGITYTLPFEPDGWIHLCSATIIRVRQRQLHLCMEKELDVTDSSTVTPWERGVTVEGHGCTGEETDGRAHETWTSGPGVAASRDAQEYGAEIPAGGQGAV